MGITSLAKLVVSDNPLTALPEALGGQQGGLCEVLADRCKLTDLPAGFARASGLLKLSCAGNALRDINSNVLAGAGCTHEPAGITCHCNLRSLSHEQPTVNRCDFANARLAACSQQCVKTECSRAVAALCTVSVGS